MKKFYTLLKLKEINYFILVLFLIIHFHFLAQPSSYNPAACPVVYDRIYASTADWTSLGGFVTNVAGSRDNNPKTAATVTTAVGLVGLGGGYLDMYFNQTFPAGTSVSVKMGKEYSGLGAVSGFLVYGLNGSTVIGSGESADAGILNLLSADNAFEFTFIPSNGSGVQAYDGVRIYFGSLLSVADSYKVYGAYVNQPVANPTCTTIDSSTNADILDVLYGVETIAGLDALSATASVVNPWDAVDNDISTYAHLNRGVAVLNSAVHTTVFRTTNQPTDSLQIILGRPDNAVLQLGLLNGFEIQLYDGDAPIGTAITNVFTGLNLHLLGITGSGGYYYALTIPTPQVYDRVTLSYGGVANVLDAIYIYDVRRKAAVSPVKPININGEIELCSTASIELNMTDACTWFDVYDTSDSLLATTTNYSFQLPAGLQENQVDTFYVQPVRQGCEIGSKQPLLIYVNPSMPASAISSILLNSADTSLICSSASQSINLEALLNSSIPLTNPYFEWYVEQTPGVYAQIVGEDSSILDLGIVSSGSYAYYLGAGSDEFCVSLDTNRAAIDFTVLPHADSSLIDYQNGNSYTICQIDTLTVSPGSSVSNPDFTWYATNDYQNLISDGDTINGAVYAINSSGDLTVYGLQDSVVLYVSLKGDSLCETNPGSLSPVYINVKPLFPASLWNSMLLNGGNSSWICEDSTQITSIQAVLGGNVTDPVFNWYWEDSLGVNHLMTGEDSSWVDLGVLTSGTYIYHAGASSNEYCMSDTNVMATLSFQVLGHSTESDVSLAASSDSLICANSTAVLVPVSSASNAQFGWYLTNDWSSPVNNGDTINNVIYTVHPDGTIIITGLTASTTLYVAVSSDSLCNNYTGTMLPAAISVTPVFNDSLIAAVYLNGNDTSAICASDTQTIYLSAVLNTSISNPQYNWYSDQLQLLQSSTSSTYDAGILAVGSYTFYLGISSEEYCQQADSNLYAVSFVVFPQADSGSVSFGNGGNEQVICSGEAVTFQPQSTISNAQFGWYLSNDNSQPVNDGDQIGGAIYTIDASGNLTVSGVSENTILYVSVWGDSICENTSGNLTEVKIIIVPLTDATIHGESDNACVNEQFTYTTTMNMAPYTWTVSGGIIVSGGTAADSDITIQWDTTGVNYLTVSFVDTAGCGQASVDTLFVQTTACGGLEIFKEANTSSPFVGDQVVFTITLVNNGSLDYDSIVVSEVIPSGYTFGSYTTTNGSYSAATGEWNVTNLNGKDTAYLYITVTVNSTGDFVNTVNIISFEPGMGTIDNGTASATAEPLCIVVYNEFSPNGDGQNETFTIDCIENYPDSKLWIFNRYGNELFYVTNYKNNWNGVANTGGVIGQGEVLPTGTYYYILEIPSIEAKKSGWLYLLK